jgi:hypothetical protein
MNKNNNTKINILCLDQIGLNILNNNTSQANIYLPLAEKDNTKKILSACIEYIFNLHNLKKPFFFYNEKNLVNSLTLSNINIFNNNTKMTVSIFSKDAIYKLKIIGICESDIYYIGTSKETMQNVISALKSCYNNTVGDYFYKDKQLDSNTPLLNCNFIDRYSINEIKFMKKTIINNNNNNNCNNKQIIDCDNCNNKFYSIYKFNEHNTIDCRICKIKTCNIVLHLNKQHIKCPECERWSISLSNHKCINNKEIIKPVSEIKSKDIPNTDKIKQTVADLNKFRDETEKLKKMMNDKEKGQWNNKIIPSTLRHTVWTTHFGKTYEGKCFCCKSIVIEVPTFEVGHIISSNKGGLNTLENLRPVCGQCNKSMGNKNMYDFISEFNMWNV